MKIEMTPTNRLILAMLVIGAMAVAFWMLALSPKREEVSTLDKEVAAVEASLSQHRAEVAQGLEARDQFSSDYQQLVVLGKAVPGDDDTASLLVELNRIAKRSKVKFDTFTLAAEGEASSEEASTSEQSSEESVSPTEVAASTLPLGATVGSAGLAVMPYKLDFRGDFFKFANFIRGLDSLVRTKNANVTVDGRLITIDGFKLQADSEVGFPRLEANVAVTTYLTPPSQGITAGASPTGPGAATATPASTTIGGTP
jgi:Tfp pilus assembly protein PilO